MEVSGCGSRGDAGEGGRKGVRDAMGACRPACRAPAAAVGYRAGRPFHRCRRAGSPSVNAERPTDLSACRSISSTWHTSPRDANDGLL